MKYDLASMIKRPKGSSVSLPQIHPSAGTELAMLKALRQLETEAASVIRELILPAFGRASLVNDADESTFEQFKALMASMVRAITGQFTDILKLEGQKHTAKWISSAKKTFSIDLAGIVKEEDLQTYLDAAALRNASLIKGLSDDIVKRVQLATTNALISGKSAKQLQTELKDQLGFSDSRARLIARDQTSKLNSDLNRKRHQDAGVNKYNWRTSHDERVRSLHRAIDGNEYEYGKPTGAEGGLPPGQPIQCRCVAQGIVEF